MYGRQNGSPQPGVAGEVISMTILPVQHLEKLAACIAKVAQGPRHQLHRRTQRPEYRSHGCALHEHHANKVPPRLRRLYSKEEKGSSGQQGSTVLTQEAAGKPKDRVGSKVKAESKRHI